MFQLGLVAYDDQVEADIARTNLTINVNRNPSSPQFTTTAYSVTVNEEENYGTSLTQLEASDADEVCSCIWFHIL